MWRKMTLMLAGILFAGSLISAAEESKDAAKDAPKPPPRGERGERGERRGPQRDGERGRGFGMGMNPQQLAKFKLTEEEQKAVREAGEKTRQLADAYRKDKTEENKAALKKQIETTQADFIARLKAATTRLETEKADVAEQKEVLARFEKNQERMVEMQLRRLTEDRPARQSSRRPGGARRPGGEKPAPAAAKETAPAQ